MSSVSSSRVTSLESGVIPWLASQVDLPDPGRPTSTTIRGRGLEATYNDVRLALGDDPEVEAAGTNTGLASAQALTKIGRASCRERV